MTPRHIETHRLVWSGVTVEIRWEPYWLNITDGFATGHLEVESIAPERAMLPITETGYRSHFTSIENIAAYGGPADYVEAWLETEAQAPDWRARDAQSRQLTLF